jgi:hypothetical protein
MHGLGKFLGVLAVIGSFVSVFFAARTLQVRNEWRKLVETKRAAYQGTIDPLRKAKRELLDTTAEWERVSYGWTPYKSNLNVLANGDGQILVNGLGTTDSWIKQNQVIHGYAPVGAAMIYVGAFQVTLAEQGRIGAKAMWAQRGQFPDNWDGAQKDARLRLLEQGLDLKPWNQQFPFGGGWRFRAVSLDLPRLDPQGMPVPPATDQSHPRYDVMHISQLLTYKDEVYLDTYQFEIAAQRSLLLANQSLTMRQNELNGDDSLKGKTLPKHMIVGVVKAIEDTDEERNATLGKVSALRRRLKRMDDEVKRLRVENGLLIQSLPGGSASPTSATTAALSASTK